MVQSLEQYVAEATKAYQPASDAIQGQLNALSGQLETTNQKINRNYAQQQAGLNRSRNAAAETASMQAAGSGGSFGGAANLANRRYYDQTFVPAQTQLQTNQANELEAARQASEDQSTSLNSQLANLQAQANQQALAQYYSDQQLEKQLAEQRRAAAQQAAAQNSYYKYLMDAMKGGESSGTPSWDFGNGYKAYRGSDGEAIYTLNGNEITRGRFLEATGSNGVNWDLWKDIWNTGTKTNGIGSDTIAAFNRKSPTSSNYNYLF